MKARRPKQIKNHNLVLILVKVQSSTFSEFCGIICSQSLKLSDMKTNMSLSDRKIRMVAAVVIEVLYFSGWIDGTIAAVLGTLAILFVLTSFTGFCPLYRTFHLRSKLNNA